MITLFLGVDVSKGYADAACMEQAGGLIVGGGRYDDTPAGHNAMSAWVTGTMASRNGACLVVGLESSGGLERNWMRLFRTMAADLPVKAYLLNPLAVKRFLERDLHRNVTDALSARGIAKYLRQGMSLTEVPYEPYMEGFLTLYRCLRGSIGRVAMMQNELQSLLPRVHPGLVRFCRQGFPAWVLALLARYPTASKLARAKPETLARIPYLTLARARTLVAEARESVAAQIDDHTGVAVGYLSREIAFASARVAEIRKRLCGELRTDEGVRILKSIPGIGLWSAVCLRLEIGPIERFPAPESLVAYAGLDPRIRQSGDGEHHIGISRRGRRQIRAILFPVALAAVRHNPVIRAFYARLRAAGKKPMVCVVACMRKMLHLAYACWITGNPFDPGHAITVSHKQARPDAPAVPAHLDDPPGPPPSLDAPVSRREAAKRKAATLPQTRIARRMRGPGTAFVQHSNSHSQEMPT